jgi:hypothetical protein
MSTLFNFVNRFFSHNSINSISASNFSIGIASDLGLPALGMNISSSGQFVMEFVADINFIIGYDNGTIYLDTSLQNEIVLFGTLRSNNVTIAGTLGILEVDASLGTRDLMRVEYGIDISKPGNKITTTDVVAGLTATSDLKIASDGVTIVVTAQLVKGVSATLGIFNPTLSAQLVFSQWNSTTKIFNPPTYSPEILVSV